MAGGVIYFSRRGENFIAGKLIDIAVGNTEIIARRIAEKLNADLFELTAVQAYPDSYQETVKLAEKEKQQQISKEYVIDNLDLSKYQTIFLGYPNWWGSFPQVVASFLRENEWQGKIIYPFCTHEGSAMGSSIKDLEVLCPGAKIKDGLPVRGSKVEQVDTAIMNWLSGYKK